MSLLVFAIKTVPDIEGGRRLYSLQDLSDKEVANVMFYKRRQESGASETLRLHLQRVCSISLLLHEAGQYRHWTIAAEDEAELLAQFHATIEQHSPQLISWNGSDFALPVLNYRSLRHAIGAASYWQAAAAQWELSALLAEQATELSAPLDELAVLLGLPANPAMDELQVWEAYRHGSMAQLCMHGEREVLNTYLIHLRLQLLQGRLSVEQHAAEWRRLRDSLPTELQLALDTLAVTSA